ncbi:hypothetical protein Ciccas_013900, partial [Cichlidogyrus casuarinus]
TPLGLIMYDDPETTQGYTELHTSLLQFDLQCTRNGAVMILNTNNLKVAQKFKAQVFDGMFTLLTTT